MTSSSHSWLKGLSLAVSFFLLTASGATAQLTTPLHVGNLATIANEFGDPLPGSASQPGALVLLLWASNSVIYPPGIDGAPHPMNPIVSNGLTAIGKSISPAIEQSGRFSLSLSEPRPTSGKVFVRVFNKPTLGESSFYSDSELFTISGNKEFIAVLGPTTNALDTADDDSDGLNNSWEKSYGADPNNPDTDGDGIADGAELAVGGHPALADTDGDGMLDGHELRAGTLLNDNHSYLGLAAVTPSAQHLIVRWASVPGRAYQIEGAANLMNPAFSNLTAVIPADPGAETSATLTNALFDTPAWILRVRLVED